MKRLTPTTLALLLTIFAAGCNPVTVAGSAMLLAEAMFDNGPPSYGDSASTDPPAPHVQLASDTDGLLVTVDGVEVPMPSLSTDIAVRVQGDWQDVRVTQVYSNTHQVVADARYVFPLPHDAAVYDMVMTVGDERIRAVIDTVQQATATFEQAAAAGNTAALLTESRPNIFVQRLANLPPGESVTVEIAYAAPVDRVDAAWEIAVPLVVGPRFTPPGAAAPAQPGAVEGVNTAGATSEPRVSVNVLLDAGLPIRHLSSRSHRIDEATDDDGRTEVSLVGGRVADNRDFLLRWEVGGDEVSVAQVHAADTGESGFFALRVEPPAAVEQATARRREMVFVLDTSGSMGGRPMELSCALVSAALRTLRPGDTFRVVRFGDEATEYSATPIEATPASVERAIAYVNGLEGMGGTMMSLAVQQALAPPVPEGALRMVVFLTDGYIGNEEEIMAQVNAARGDARLFSVGVGNGVNRWLLQEMGGAGRGFSRMVDLDEDPERVVAELVARWETPVWTDVSIDWGDAPVSEVTPAELPDLFAGHPLRVVGRYEHGGTYEVSVRGTRNGQVVSVPITLTLREHDHDAWLTLGRLWARSRVADLTRDHADANFRGESEAAVGIESQITELGLAWRLVTPWTAFVAVSERVVDPNGTSTQTEVAVPMADGVGLAAYGGSMGSATPEPGTLLGLLTAALVGGVARRRRREPLD